MCFKSHVLLYALQNHLSIQQWNFLIQQKKYHPLLPGDDIIHFYKNPILIRNLRPLKYTTISGYIVIHPNTFAIELSRMITIQTGARYFRENAVFQAFSCVRKVCKADLELLSETAFAVSSRSSSHANILPAGTGTEYKQNR